MGAHVLACQEEALDQMKVLLDVAQDTAAAQVREREAKERAQKEMMARRMAKTKGVSEKAPERATDKRAKLEGSVIALSIMESDRVPADMLTDLREHLETLHGSEFFDVIQYCKIDAWLKKQSWGREKQRASRLRQYISARQSEEAAPEVESMAC